MTGPLGRADVGGLVFLTGVCRSFSLQMWLSHSRCDNGGGMAGLCCLSISVLPPNFSCWTAGTQVVQSPSCCTEEALSRQPFSSCFTTLAHIREFSSTPFTAVLFLHSLPSSLSLSRFWEPFPYISLPKFLAHSLSA